MARQLYRSAKKYMHGSLSLLSPNSETGVAAIISAVAQDPEETQAIEKTLNVLTMQGHILKTGEGANATYRLAPSGQDLLSTLGGE